MLVDQVDRHHLLVVILEHVEVLGEDRVLLIFLAICYGGLVLEVGHLGPQQGDRSADLRGRRVHM